MTSLLDRIEHVGARVLPLDLVRGPRLDLESLSECLRHRSEYDLARAVRGSAGLELPQEESIFEAAPEHFEPERRQPARVREQSVTVAPVFTALVSLVERHGVVTNIPFLAAVVSVREVQPFPGVPELHTVPLRDPTPGSERRALGVHNHAPCGRRLAVVSPEAPPRLFD